MTRRLLVALFIFAVVAPAWADSQERANALFVEAAQLIQAAKIEQDVETRLEQITEAWEILQRIIKDYPSSNLAVQLISGQSIGAYSLNGVRSDVAWAYGEALEERARNAATAIEDLLSRLAMTRTPEVGEPFVEEVEALLSKLPSEYETTKYLQDLRTKFADQRTASLNRWASIAAGPIDKLIKKLKATRTAEEGEPLVRAIEQGLDGLPQKYQSTSNVKLLRSLFSQVQSDSLNRWAGIAVRLIDNLITELNTTQTAEEGEPLVTAINQGLNDLPQKFHSTSNVKSLRARFVRTQSFALDRWVSSWDVATKNLINRLAETNTPEESAPLISAIEDELDQQSEKFGSTREYHRVQEMFRREVNRRPQAWSLYEAKPIDKSIAKLAKSESVDDAMAVADAIKRLTDKYGWTKALVTLRTRFERALDEIPQHQWVLDRLK